MRTFCGGQIKEACRGDLAMVVARNEPCKRYDVFLYPVISEEFVHLTGVRAVNYPPDRIYIGVSKFAGEIVINRTDGKNPDEVDLKGIDRLVVTPYFLNVNQEKPKRVVLESTP